METTTALILKINDLERKLDKMQEIVDIEKIDRGVIQTIPRISLRKKCTGVSNYSVNYFVMHNTWITNI